MTAIAKQRRARDRLQILGLVGFRESFDALVVRKRGANHALSPPVADDALIDLRVRPVEAVDRDW